MTSSREAQGLPPVIEDEDAYRFIAAVLAERDQAEEAA